MPQTQYYYADGVPQYWTDDSTSVNIIVKNMNNYNAIVHRLELLFPTWQTVCILSLFTAKDKK